MTIRSFQNTISNTLQPLYDSREAAAIAKLYLHTRLGMPSYELALQGNAVLSDAQLKRFEQELSLLADGLPVQYLLGETEFYGLTMKVTSAVLIPRPETEELVQRMVGFFLDHPAPLIWDVGTGSGCIAVALAKALPHAKLFATDISMDALQVAQENAARHDVDITFACHDMCAADNLPFGDIRFDAIVSNPPYIPESLRKAMHPNVRDHEPATALFVPDCDPLLFYRALAKIGQCALKPGGVLMMETYEDFHPELMEGLIRAGYTNVESIEDINGKKRFIFCIFAPTKYTL
jgi:protein-(glutamine-N5) methyltransferase, release factor-specific